MFAEGEEKSWFYVTLTRNQAVLHQKGIKSMNTILWICVIFILFIVGVYPIVLSFLWVPDEILNCGYVFLFALPTVLIFLVFGGVTIVLVNSCVDFCVIKKPKRMVTNAYILFFVMYFFCLVFYYQRKGGFFQKCYHQNQTNLHLLFSSLFLMSVGGLIALTLLLFHIRRDQLSVGVIDE